MYFANNDVYSCDSLEHKILFSIIVLLIFVQLLTYICVCYSFLDFYDNCIPKRAKRQHNDTMHWCTHTSEISDNQHNKKQ